MGGLGGSPYVGIDHMACFLQVPTIFAGQSPDWISPKWALRKIGSANEIKADTESHYRCRSRPRRLPAVLT